MVATLPALPCKGTPHLFVPGGLNEYCRNFLTVLSKWYNADDDNDLWLELFYSFLGKCSSPFSHFSNNFQKGGKGQDKRIRKITFLFGLLLEASVPFWMSTGCCAMLEKGTSTEYLMLCRSWMTMFETILNDGLRLAPPGNIALRTWNESKVRLKTMLNILIYLGQVDFLTCVDELSEPLLSIFCLFHDNTIQK